MFDGSKWDLCDDLCQCLLANMTQIRQHAMFSRVFIGGARIRHVLSLFRQKESLNHKTESELLKQFNKQPEH